MNKKIVCALVIMLLMIFSLAGCGDRKKIILQLLKTLTMKKIQVY